MLVKTNILHIRGKVDAMILVTSSKTSKGWIAKSDFFNIEAISDSESITFFFLQNKIEKKMLDWVDEGKLLSRLEQLSPNVKDTIGGRTILHFKDGNKVFYNHNIDNDRMISEWSRY